MLEACINSLALSIKTLSNRTESEPSSILYVSMFGPIRMLNLTSALFLIKSWLELPEIKDAGWPDV